MTGSGHTSGIGASQATANTGLPLTNEQRAWFDAAAARVDRARLESLIVELTNTPSPTGHERPLAELIASHLRASGLEAATQLLDEDQANAVGRYRGHGNGPQLLLYAPIDTHTSGRPEDDLPWAADELRRDMLPRASVEGDLVLGLGANNPKGHAVCVVAAAQAVREAEVPLQGDLVVGLGAGGMPTEARPEREGGRRNIGHGVGCSFMLDRGVRPDYAIIAKPTRGVLWEEAGLCWIKIAVRGRFNYAGIRHRTVYKNPIVDAATVVGALEEWFPKYSARNASGLVSPQASIGAIEGGWVTKPAYVPAACFVYLDLRLNPRTTPASARRQFERAMSDIVLTHPDLDVSWDVALAIPGTSTDEGSWIVRSCIHAWEAVEGEPHEPPTNNSGATDANILRGRGVPTARTGMPRVSEELPVPDDFSAGMNVVDLRSMEGLTRRLIYSAIDTCTRDRAEIGMED